MPRPTAPPPAPPPNTRLGEYTLVDRIAVGGMAEVFRALEPRSVGEPRVVVVKRMLPHVAAEANAERMFAEEARLGGHVSHPNVVHVIGHGEFEGKPYLTLEYVPGCDLWRLSRMLAREGRGLSLPLAIYLVRQVLNGLMAIHSATDGAGHALGIVHRDISPSNVLVSVHGDIKIADFGIARADSRVGGRQQTTTSRATGKLGYLAPEQVAGGDIDRRADLFSVGVIAAELLMRRPLFTGGSELAVLLAIRDAEVHPFVEFMPQLPEGLGVVVLKALAALPAERPPTAEAMWAALEPWQTGDEQALRAELASLVREVTTEMDNRTSGVELVGGNAEPITPIAAAELHASTTEANPLEYRIRKPNGAEVGPLLYAKVVEAVATGHVDVEDRISIADGPFQPLTSIPELARHIPMSRLTPTTSQIAPNAANAEATQFEDGGFVAAIAQTIVQRKTGLWLCEQGGVRKEVYAKNGVPSFVSSNLASELLGEYLVKNQVINRSELDMALAVMPRFEGKLGDTLVALALVEPLELFQHIAAQVREKLLDLFTWTSGSATFYEGVNPPPSGFPLRIDPWEILDQGMRRRISEGMENELILQNADNKLVQAEQLPTAIATADFPEVVAAVLKACGKPQTLDAVVQHCVQIKPDDAQVGYRAAALLLYLGALRWR